LELSDQYWQFSLDFGDIERPLWADVLNTNFKGWFIEKAATGTITEIGIPTCMQNYPLATRDNSNYPGITIRNVGIESGGNVQAGSYNYCLDDPNLNPNYDPNDGSVNYLVANGSSNDKQDDRILFYAYFAQNDGCDIANVNEDAVNNNCHQELLDQLDLQPGDKLLFDFEVPFWHNPNIELSVLNSTTESDAFRLVPLFGSFQNIPTGECGKINVATACWSSTPLEGHLPGPVTITPNVCVNDCEIDVNYTFNIENALPEVDLAMGEVPWYENEYRPFEATEYLNVKFPNNMVYEGDASICKADGTTIPIPAANIDQDGGNISCIDDGAGGVCCTAEDPSQLAGLKFADDAYFL